MLLNVEGIPEEFLPEGWEGKSILFDRPTLQRSRFRVRYLDDIVVPKFDEVDLDKLLNSYFYPYYLPYNNINIEENREGISEWIIENGGHIYVRPLKKLKLSLCKDISPMTDIMSFLLKEKKYIAQLMC